MNSRPNLNYNRGFPSNQPLNINQPIGQSTVPRQNPFNNQPNPYNNPNSNPSNYNMNQNYQNNVVNPSKYIMPQSNPFGGNQQLPNQNNFNRMQMNSNPNQNFQQNRFPSNTGNNLPQFQGGLNMMPNQNLVMNMGMNQMPRNNLNPNPQFQNKNFQQFQMPEQLFPVELSNEIGFTNNCIVRTNNNPPNDNIENIVLSIKSEKINGPNPFDLINCIGLRVGRKEEDLLNKLPEYLKNQHFLVLPIDDAKLSRCHCEIINYGGSLKIAELNTLNGTYRCLKNDEYAILNKELVFYFLNVKFKVEGFYKNKMNNSFIKIQVTDEPDQFIQICNTECSGHNIISLCHISANKEVKDIFIKILENCGPNYLNQNDELFPKIFFENGNFYLQGVVPNEQSEVLLKLEHIQDLDNNYLIDFQLNDKFNLGGETTIELININVYNNEQNNQNAQQYPCNNGCGNDSVFYFNCEHTFCNDCANSIYHTGCCVCGVQITSVQNLQY